MLAVGSTAVCRPEIVEQCYSSFVKNIVDIKLSDCLLYLNVDPIPDAAKSSDVVKVAKKYFKYVEARLPDKPDFSLAMRWIWQRCVDNKYKYLLNLEDDWVLLCPIKLHEWLKIFEQNPHVLQIRFRYKKKYYNDSYIGPTVSIYRTSIFPKVIPYLQGGANPLVGMKRACEELNWVKPGILVTKDIDGKIVAKDIGRAWMRKHNFNILNKTKHTWDQYL